MRPKNPRIRPNQQILEEASTWFVDFRVGDVGAQARDEFSAWLRRSPDHIQAYMEIATIYAEIPAPNAAAKLDVEALIAYARAAPDGNVRVLSWGHRRRPNAAAAARPARWYATAAALLLTVASFSAWFYVQRGTYATDFGEQRSIVLADGSTISMNARSRIRVRYTHDERRIELLQGQALFRVAKDANRVFLVNTGGTQVRAVGTQFDINRKRSATIVTVVEGTVAVMSMVAPDSPDASASSGRSFLNAGEQLTLSALPENAPIQVTPQPANVAAAIAWTQREFVFEDASLDDVAEEFNRYSPRPLIVDSAELRELHISGVYSSTNPDSLLRFLRAQPGIRVTETDAAIRIARD